MHLDVGFIRNKGSIGSLMISMRQIEQPMIKWHLSAAFEAAEQVNHNFGN